VTNAHMYMLNIKESRATAMTDMVGDKIVDTVRAFDTGRWETGICNKSGHWIIVEEYPDAEEAMEGHAEWIHKIIVNPGVEFTDIFKERFYND